MVCEKRDLRGKKEIKTGFHPLAKIFGLNLRNGISW